MSPVLSNRRLAVTPVVGLVTGDGPGGSLTPASLLLQRGEVAVDVGGTTIRPGPRSDVCRKPLYIMIWNIVT